MQTPIVQFVEEYSKKKSVRFHMPGHKGNKFLGLEDRDITEIEGAGVLYEDSGIISLSEKNAAKLFGTDRTFYSTEGSSQCIKAMLHLLCLKSNTKKPTIIAARNVHKAFVQAAALLDLDVVWLENKNVSSLAGGTIEINQIEKAIQNLDSPPIAVYITSPDYLGNMADIENISELCHKYNIPLCVDNAHGAYLHFLDKKHPMDLGADICCDSAHKTLPVLTGGAYLHISKSFECFTDKQIKDALSLFGSTSPSYLILASLDMCNNYLYSRYKQKLREIVEKIDEAKKILKNKGWEILVSDPLRITMYVYDGFAVAQKLRENNIEPEYSENHYLVLMLTTENSFSDLEKLVEVLGENIYEKPKLKTFSSNLPIKKMSIRQALFSKSEIVDVNTSIGRICAAVSVSCPPAVPIIISGEIINKETVEKCLYYGIEKISVIS